MEKPKVTLYSCSGCSNVAQLANNVAVRLHRSGEAKMSCIAGVGGDVPSLVKTAQKAEKILALDGCPLACVSHCLKRHGVVPDEHIILTEHGLTKNTTEEFPAETVEEFTAAVRTIIRKLNSDNDDESGLD